MRQFFCVLLCLALISFFGLKKLHGDAVGSEGKKDMPATQSEKILKLKQNKFMPLKLGSIQPAGWLKNQLRIQADGLSGHLDEFWPDIQRSRWFGGDADGWERAPYWLDGVVPLAYLLDDKTLKQRINKYMDQIIQGQDENGWIGPQEDASRYDLWAVFLVLKPLIQYYEATNDERVPGVVKKCLKWVDGFIGRRPLINWGKYRWFETLISIYWLYEQKNEDWLYDLAVKLHAQGFDWIDFFKRWPLKAPTTKGDWNYMGHVVNNAMAIKTPALWWRLTGEERDRLMTYEMIEKLDQYHGTVFGMFSGDECLSGKDPSQGTELCAVVEYMYSLEILLAVLGSPEFGDRLEKITFNALPATFSPDMWSHQYDQQVNQVECSIRDDRNWTTNGAESNIFGLEPNYGCCTSNLSQGWPKFASHLWMRTPDKGLAAMVYAPCRVATDVKGVSVKIDVKTDYPFRDKILLMISVDQPKQFPIYLRIPSWAENASVQVSGEKDKFPESGKFFRLEKVWKDTSELILNFPMTPRASRRYNNAIAIERGPLVYALKLDEDWKQVNKDKPMRELPHGDWEVYSKSAWNYALDVNENTLEDDVVFKEHPLGQYPFSPDGAPITADVHAMLMAEWKLEFGSCGEIPISPVRKTGKLTKVVLIPYGCTNLRIAEFPTLR